MSDDENEGTVLLVDDEEAIREALGELLESCGFEILLADCYKSAVKVLDKDHAKIEAVVSDLKMPGESGVEVLRYINEKDFNIPLIFLTGFGTLESCQAAVQEGAFDYVLKPIDNKDKIIFPLSHAVEKYRLEKRALEMQRDIIQMAEEHQKILEGLLSDVEMKARVEDKIGKILEKYDE